MKLWLSWLEGREGEGELEKRVEELAFVVSWFCHVATVPRELNRLADLLLYPEILCRPENPPGSAHVRDPVL